MIPKYTISVSGTQRVDSMLYVLVAPKTRLYRRRYVVGQVYTTADLLDKNGYVIEDLYYDAEADDSLSWSEFRRGPSIRSLAPFVWIELDISTSNDGSGKILTKNGLLHIKFLPPESLL